MQNLEGHWKIENGEYFNRFLIIVELETDSFYSFGACL
jgi:hypothetical protein